MGYLCCPVTVVDTLNHRNWINQRYIKALKLQLEPSAQELVNPGFRNHQSSKNIWFSNSSVWTSVVNISGKRFH